ncbi:hypothetical protein A7P96_06940 [Eikenella sp. NML03-A-027]|uniref:hypothetical protein n=1 Tax=Eikenella sp. NML03-A-027 TaxID=1795828 RepID=UPI0007DFF927|nr:hypothetical protein [Eikenella sp. NML03-A-027]OAM30338.1 hypothetical protein A7P96_06940 [Eikenella sp. NML03-A-027]
MSKPLPKFVSDELLTGLQKLMMLRLEGAPPADGIKLTASVWVEAIASVNISWAEQLDKGRITAGFTRLFAEIERWPTPKMLIRCLPPRPEPPKLEHKRQLTPEEEARGRENLKKLYQIIAEIFERKKQW